MNRTVLFWLAISLWGTHRLPAQIAGTGDLSWQERWDNYVRRTWSPKKLAWVAAETAFDHSFEASRSGHAMFGFPDEIGGVLVRKTARNTIELGMGALLREDIRRRPSELSGIRQRALFAILHAPLARGPHGEWRPAYSRFAGTFGAVAVTSAWDGRPLTGSELFGNFGFSAANYIQDALFTEFEPDMKRLAQRYLARRVWQIPGMQAGKYFGLRLPTVTLATPPAVDPSRPVR